MVSPHHAADLFLFPAKKKPMLFAQAPAGFRYDSFIFFHTAARVILITTFSLFRFGQFFHSSQTGQSR